MWRHCGDASPEVVARVLLRCWRCTCFSKVTKNSSHLHRRPGEAINTVVEFLSTFLEPKMSPGTRRQLRNLFLLCWALNWVSPAENWCGFPDSLSPDSHNGLGTYKNDSSLAYFWALCLAILIKWWASRNGVMFANPFPSLTSDVPAQKDYILSSEAKGETWGVEMDEGPGRAR